MKNLIIISFLILLSSCSSITIPQQKTVIPSNLSSPCVELEGLPEGANMGDLLEVSIRNNQAYIECAEKHKKLVELVDG